MKNWLFLRVLRKVSGFVRHFGKILTRFFKNFKRFFNENNDKKNSPQKNFTNPKKIPPKILEKVQKNRPEVCSRPENEKI